MTATGLSLQEQVAWASRILASEGYADLTLGHVSARGDDGRIYIKRKGMALDEVEPDDVVAFAVDEPVSAFPPDMHLEAVLHQAVYQARPDVGSVVHGHPPFATALGAASARLELLTHDAVLFADGVPAYEARPSSSSTPSRGGRRDRARPAPGAADAQSRRARDGQGRAVGHAGGRDARARGEAQSIAAVHGPLQPIPAEAALRMVADKYRDEFVAEYWAAWTRKAGRVGAGAGMRA